MVDTPKPSYPSAEAANRLSAPTLAALFIIMSLLIAGGGCSFYLVHKRAKKSAIQAELSAIADLKTRQIVHWREERLADAAIVSADPFLAAMMERRRSSALDEEARMRLMNLLLKFVSLKGYHYATLLDTAGRTLLGTSNYLPLCDSRSIRQLFDSAVTHRRIVMTDLHSKDEGSGPTHLTVFAPIVNLRDSTVSGLVVLGIDPGQFLFPLIEAWPTPNKTAEVLLIKRDGDSVLFLNDLRFRDNTARSFRIPIGGKRRPSVCFASHFAGTVEEVDYRGVPVLAAVRAIPATDWYMVAKIDKKEAFAVLRMVFMIAFVIVALLILLNGVIIALYQRHRTSLIYKRLFFMEQEKNSLATSLSSSENLFKALFESMTEGVALHEIVFDDNGNPCNYRIVAVNPAYERHTGISPIHAMGKLATEVYGTAEPPYLKEFSAVAITGVPYSFKTFFPPLNRHFAVSVFSPGKNRFATVFEDITEREKVEAELNLARSRAQRYLDTVEAIIVALDTEGRITLINRKGCCLLGREEAELIGKSWFETCLPAPLGMETVYPVFTKLISGEMESLEYFENPVIARDGTIRHIAWHNSVLRDDAGKITGTLSAGEDITERKKVEDALIAEKERLSVTLSSIGDAVIATDTQGCIVLMNKVAETLTGWDSAEALGRKLSEVFVIINELTHEPCENPVEKVLSTGKIVMLSNHTMLVRRDGSRIVIADSGAPIRDRDGVTIGVVLVFRDNTERQRAQEAMRKAEQLESLGILAGGIAHDFNNLLSGIFGYLDLARHSMKSDEPAVEYLEKAFSVFGRAKYLTGQLLTFAKGGFPARKTRSLPPIIRDTVSFALSGSSIRPVFHIASDLMPCDIDENQMGQVLDNIIINAREAMPFGGTITVRADNLPPGSSPYPALVPGNYVHISISDQGTGIAPEHLPHIFDPFYTTKQKGSGLGLAVSYSIIKRHDGLIEAESQLGKGTVFHIYLPASAKPEGSNLQGGAATAFHKGSGRALVMDDEDYIRDIASKILSGIGYEVDTASSGEEAVKKFSEAQKAGKPYVIALLDLTIPGGMGGRETKDRLHRLSPDVKIIGSSGYSEDPIMANPRDYGFDASVKKPYTKEELETALATLMAK